MEDWIDYYDSTHTIYVSKLHRDVHFRVIANDIIRHIPAPDAVVLDYSCGEALSSPDVAAKCGHLILAEPAPGVRGRLTARFKQNPKITIRSLDELQQQPDRTIDLAVINSVAQYMTPDELDKTLILMRRILKPAGQLVLGDILRPDVGAPADVMALLKLAAKNGFLTDALWGLARTALSDYWQLRQNIGLQRYAEADMIAKLEAASFSATRAPVNIGYNPARMTFVATRSD
ncbi:class I SAM-dependent methyltransferase [Bradyrhizobium sp. SYSU BS000235]|uniref:class I SAM-dependent methyltransferase n=1 Tax=Bradyrhizobium sp. SYSU BS000235 TaxID=3411332 RepID=UPI003C706B02